MSSWRWCRRTSKGASDKLERHDRGLSAWDSRRPEFIIRIEQTFGILLEDGEVEKVRTISDLEELIIRKLGAEHRSSQGVCEVIVRVLIEEFDRKSVRLNRLTTFIDDLDMT